MDFWKHVRLFTFILVVFITTRDPSRDNTTRLLRPFTPRDFNSIVTHQFMLSSELQDNGDTGSRLEYDFYRESCPAAENQLPSPFDDLSEIISSFATRGFDERETVTLLGARSFGSIHCRFFEERLYNFSGTNRPDPSLEIGFLNLMRSRCNRFHSAFTSESVAASLSYGASRIAGSFNGEPEAVVNYEEMGAAEGPVFGAPYYRSLLEGRGILFADQQLMGSEETGSWVRAYAWDAALFGKDFAEAMLKLSSLQVLTPANSQVRLNCSKVT